jgi:undecaprenyl diphosphate synthase
MNSELSPDLVVPAHIGIIMDGNGRWAQARGLPRHEGHRQGTENLREILQACGDFGIKHLTIYAFSTENWGRPKAEVNFLIRILESVIDRELRELHAKGVQLRHMGNPSGLSKILQRKVSEAVELTQNNDKLILNVAFDYGGRAEIVRACQQIVAAGFAPEDITEELVNHYLYTTGQPDPDMIIRTGGDLRISNFMIWQAAYAELYVTEVFWPDFGRDELKKAILAFNQRERRFGLVPERTTST